MASGPSGLKFPLPAVFLLFGDWAPPMGVPLGTGVRAQVLGPGMSREGQMPPLQPAS